MPRLLALFAAAFLLGSFAHADWIETFPSGTTTNTWQFGLQPTGNDASYGYFNGGATMQSGSTFPQGGALVTFNVVTSTFSGTTGVRTRAVVNPFGESVLSRNVGVMSLFDDTTGNAYALTVDYLAGNLNLARITSGSITVTASTSIFGFGASSTYTLELDVTGSDASGRAFISGTGLIANVAWPDPFPLAAGVSGIVAQREITDPTLYGVYGTVSAVALPEPTTRVVMIAAAGLACLGWLRRDRARGSANARGALGVSSPGRRDFCRPRSRRHTYG